MTDFGTANGGVLSVEARARLASTHDDDPVPDILDQSAAGRQAVASWRAEQHRSWGEDTAVGETDHRPVSIAGVPCLVAGRDDAAITVVYLHGGGYCLGSPGTSIPITARLVRSGDPARRVISVGYRLAPEHPFPAGLDDAVAVYGHAVSGATPGPVALAGDSAGAGLALAVALQAARTGVALPIGVMLLCPHLDHRRLPTNAGLATMLAAYVGAADPADALVSPAAATDPELPALPPILLQTTTTEALFPNAVAFAQRLDRLGVAVTSQIWDGLWHTWHYHRELPEAWDAVDRCRRWLADLL
ncbi:MAG: monoterpene epsilon-lactone hydrolase [Acidimicrobiales bacterium]|jgi:epsilon-lactone hydrolase